jgi:hypothetical protein
MQDFHYLSIVAIQHLATSSLRTESLRFCNRWHTAILGHSPARSSMSGHPNRSANLNRKMGSAVVDGSNGGMKGEQHACFWPISGVEHLKDGQETSTSQGEGGKKSSSRSSWADLRLRSITLPKDNKMGIPSRNNEVATRRTRAIQPRGVSPSLPPIFTNWRANETLVPGCGKRRGLENR